MYIIEKRIFDSAFKHLPFWEAVDKCIEISKHSLGYHLDIHIERIRFMDTVLRGDGFITYDTTTHGDFVPFREMTIETNLREV